MFWFEETAIKNMEHTHVAADTAVMNANMSRRLSKSLFII